MFPRLKNVTLKASNPSSSTPAKSRTFPKASKSLPRFEPYKNMNVILDSVEGCGSLFLGDFQAALDKTKLKNMGVKTVLSVAIGVNVHYPPSSGIENFRYPAQDIESYDLSRYFEDTFNKIDNGLKKGGVLVHCMAGVSRSATIVIAYLMKKNGWGFLEAFNFVKKKRSVIGPNSGFVKQLKTLERKVKTQP